MKALVVFLMALSSVPAFSQDASPAETPMETPVQGTDSAWRVLTRFGMGTLAMRGSGAQNILNTDYDRGYGADIGILANYRPTRVFGLETGLKVLHMARKAKGSDLSLGLTYLAIPLEARFSVIPIRKRSAIFLKGGLTYLILLHASVSENRSSSSGDTDFDDWDDAYPSPPVKGSYRSSFNSTDILASAGFGGDFLLFQIKDSFNMSVIPEIMYYRGLTNIAKSGEFGGRVYNEGLLVGLSIGYGF